jgi:cytochrome P450
MTRPLPTPPGPRGLLRKGALLSFPRHPDAFRRITAKYGDIASFRVGSQQFFVVNHPDLARELLITQAASFVKGWGPVAGNTVLGHGLITAEGDLHRQQRRLILPAFHRQENERHLSTVVRLVTQWVASLPGAATIDLLAATRSITLRILLETLFGGEEEVETVRLAAAVDVLFRRFAGRMHAFAGPMRRLQKRSALEAARATHELRDAGLRILRARRALPRQDLASLLLAARDEQGDPLPDEQIIDEIVTFFVAGHETISLAVTWSCLLLARDPDAQTRLHEEIDAVLDARTFAWSDLRQLSYTTGVLAEAMRLYPPQWMLGRRAIEPVVLGGYDVPHGAHVLLCLSSLHRDERWFDDGDTFRPERWSGGVEKGAAPLTYLPFGAGTRRCVGEGFAWMEATVLLSELLRAFRVLPESGRPEMDPLLMLRPRNSSLRFERRR